MFKKILKIYSLLVLSFYNLNAQNTTPEFSSNFTISNGLAHNGVTSILEDSKGYLWFGTYDGINKYDGYEFVTLKNTFNKDILTSNRVRTISEDKKGNLWFGTDEGITIFKYSDEKFVNLKFKLENGKSKKIVVRKIVVCNKSNKIICATEGNGILIFNDDYTYQEQFYYLNSEEDSNVLFYNILQIDDFNFLCATSVGLLNFNLQKKQFQPILKNYIDHSKFVVKIDDKNLLIVGLYGISFVEISKEKETYKFQIKKELFKGHQFAVASIGKSNDMWLGSLNEGLFHFNDTQSLMSGKGLNLAAYKLNLGALRVSGIDAVTNSGCWVSTYNKGVYKFDTKKNPFKSYNTKMNFSFGPKTNDISYLAAVDDAKIFLSATRGGMSLFNIKTEKFEPLPFDIPKEYLLRVASIFLDSRQDLWVKVTGEGFFKVKKGSKKIEKINLSGFKWFDAIQSRTITEDRDGNIWFGATEGLFKVVVDTNGDVKKIESVNRNPLFKNKEFTLVRKVYLDPAYDFVWVGNDTEGLLRINFKEPLETTKIGQFVKDKKDPSSISANFVTSIVRLPNDELWIGTEGGGICKVLNSNKTPKFLPFTELNGLSNNVVKGISFDEEYNLWIATNIGLNKFSTKDFKFRRFNESDGLPFEDFWYAQLKMKNGDLVFSGLDGFCYFNPKDIPSKELIPVFELGNFKIFNKPVSAGDTIENRIVLTKRLTELSEINLKHNENVFSLDITSLHFLNPDNHQIKYKLLPINNDWIEVPSHQKTIYYNGLQPGEYELNVMASNSLNEWSVPKKLKISISPPFWKTGWAYLLYMLFWVFVIFVVVYFVYRIQNLNHNLQIEQLEKDNVKEVNAAKLQFFSNISHEIKTPITLISGPIDILKDWFRNNFEVREKLDLIHRQTKKISQLIDQVHDFQRSDANLLKMNYSQFCFNSFIKNLVSDFEFMAKKEIRDLILIEDENKIYVSADKDKLEKLFNNLLNNAFKYSNANDTIKITYETENNNLIVYVNDTGRGIDSEDLPHVFERFYQSHNSHSSYTGGSGIGLAFSKRLVDMHYGYINVESEIHKGSTFKVCIPVVIKNFNENQDELNEEILLKERNFEQKEYVVEKLNLSSITTDEVFKNAKIFFAEDNFDMRNFIAGILTNFFEVVTFTNGQECLNALNEEWPDIIVSDVLMPELNGFDLCKAVKNDIKTSHIPVVLLTACTSVEDQIQGINEGADAYIRKPFNVQQLVSSIESLLRTRKQLRERFKIDFPLTLEKSNDNNSKDNIFLEKLYALMEENLDNPEIDMNDLAKKLYLNRTHFYQKVKALTDQTPFELLKDFRLKKAAEYLVQKGMSVKEVFAITGFKSRSHFSKRFKEKYDLTPGNFVSQGLKKMEEDKKT